MHQISLQCVEHPASLRNNMGLGVIYMKENHLASELLFSFFHKDITNFDLHVAVYCTVASLSFLRNGSRRKAWWLPREHYEPIHFNELQTGPTPDIMVRDGIIFDHRMLLVHIDGRLKVDRNVTHVVEPVFSALVAGLQPTRYFGRTMTGHILHVWLLDLLVHSRRRGNHLPISDPACNILPPPPHTTRRNYLPCKRWTPVKSVKSQSIRIYSFGCSEGEAPALKSSLPLERDSELRAFSNNAPFTS
ncbi:hypothetical protein TNCV_1965751 [Trichonephila clavipes]|nr:hypothetical protein TNCV_1965751 [Trichonephila clavipes]